MSVSQNENPSNTAQKKRGGKLNRSKIIQARLSPDLHCLAEKMARDQRRTLSSFIEMLIAAEAERKQN